MIAAVMLYLSMVLIGRRHWVRGQGLDRAWPGTTLVRVLALVVIAVGVDRRSSTTTTCVGRDQREAQLALARDRRSCSNELEPARPVQIEAFVSPTVPEAYVQTRLNLLSMLRGARRPAAAARSRCGSTTRSGSARRRPGPRSATASRRGACPPRHRGTLTEENIFLGVAFTCGLQKVTLPFIDRGIPVEYELVRSILHRHPAEAEEDRRAADRRPALRPLQHADACRSTQQLADHRRAAEAVRRGARSTPPARSPRSTTCSWPCSPRRLARSR